MLLSLVFADGAFAASGLTGPEQLFRLRVPEGLNQQELPIKDSMTGVPIFRRLERTVHGVGVSPSAAATDNWLRERLATLGAVTGFALPVGPYCFRRGNGEALDNSSMSLLPSDGEDGVADCTRSYKRFPAQSYLTACELGHFSAQLSLTIHHSGHAGDLPWPGSADCNNEGCEWDDAIHRSTPAQTSQRQPTGGGEAASRGQAAFKDAEQLGKADSRQLRHHHADERDEDLREVPADLPTAPEQGKGGPQGADGPGQASYGKRRPLADIDSQLNGSPVRPEEKTAFEAESQAHLSEERRRAFTALFTFTTSEPAEECQRRADAVNAVTVLSRRQELPMRKASRIRQTYSTGDIKKLDGEADPATEPKVGLETFPIECLPMQCIFCLGQSELPLEHRKKTFRNHDGLKRHFHRKHLRHHPDGEPIDCPHPECNARLCNKAHLQNHAATVHKTLT